ncbi:hypothetical protein YQE_00198, partial [Dendroctonus ponderosae]
METEKNLDFGMRCIKYMLCVANLMFVIVGLLLICIGYTIKTIYLNFDEFMETYYYNPSTLAIVIGFFIFIVALFGCIGALKESTFLVNSYAFFLTIIFILQLSVSIAAYAMRSNIENSVHSNMLQAMKYYDVSYNAFTWNSTQYNVLGIVFASMLAKSIRKVKTQRLVEREERRRNFYDQVVKNQEAKPKTPMLYTPKDSEA